VQINEFGFMGANPILSKSSDRVNICLLGGSFAQNFYLDSRETLKQSLQRHGLFKGKEIQIISLALSGYKQPQQLLALSYMLSEGAEYDLVINLDGFNEAALPFAENVPMKVYPSYPRLWRFYAARILNVEGAVQFAGLVEQTERRRSLQELFSKPALSLSNLGLIVWEALDRRLEAGVTEHTAALERLVSESDARTPTRNFESGGPTLPPYPSDAQFFSARAEHWARTSTQIERLGIGAAFHYFHFLQPNQYVQNSKPFSSQEKTLAFSPRTRFPFRLAVEAAYPLLIERGRRLAADGIKFTDLTGIFGENRVTIYEDVCCHVNKYGNDVVAEKIAATIANHYRSLKP